MPETEHQMYLLYLQIPRDVRHVFKFQNCEFSQPPVLRHCVKKKILICAVIKVIGRKFIVLITPLPVE